MKFGQFTHGMSLVEVMVTLTMLAVAAIAMTTTCAHARVTASRAMTLTAAWRLASELADWLRMRGDLPLGQLPTDPSALIGLRSNAGICYARACSPEESARFFLGDWYRRLHRSLPGAMLVLCRQSASTPATATTSGWSCGGGGSNGNSGNGSNRSNGSADITQIKLGWRQRTGEREVLSVIELTVLHAN